MAENLSIVQDDDIIRNRAVGLFTYLKKIAELRSRPIYNIDEYEKIIWFSEVPKEKECFTPAWGEIKTGQEEIWLGIRKVNFIKPPPVPIKVQPWVNETDLLKSSDIPELQEKILTPTINKTDALPQYIELSNYPDVSEQWEKYLDEKWLPWAEENERQRKVQAVYSKLHAIYQLQKALGETYELVVGFGLLSWKTSSNLYRRHLITAQASVDLDTKKGTLFLKQGAEGAKLNLEQDMLDTQERCSTDIYNSITEQFSGIGDDVWDISASETILKTWMHSVSPDGVYSASLNPPKDLSQVLNITYAPTIILRRRRQLKLAETYDKIITQIKNGDKIPFGIRRIIKITDDFNREDNEHISTASNDSFQEILFPKLANDEQRRIVEYLRSRQGVLVQGPPGTGKSHTIVNLICHLLASGKRVLVTSQTPRALKVIKTLMPKEVAALCVNLLGSDKDSLQSLKESVEGIVHRKFEWDQNPTQNGKLIPQLKSQLESLNKQKAELIRKLYEIRESETYRHRICDGAYEGTSQKIAEKVSSEQIKHGWLDITVEEKTNPPLSDDEASELVQLYRNISRNNVKELLKKLPQVDQLLTLEKFASYCADEKEAKVKYDAFERIRENVIYRKIKTVDAKSLIQLRSELQKFVSMWGALSKNKQPWVCSMIDDIVSERDRRWRHLLDETEKCIEKLPKHIEQIDKCSLKIAEGHDRSVIKADVESLLKHFEQGGKIKNWIVLYPKVVKNARYLIEDTYIDGKLCDNTETLKKLLNLLDIPLPIVKTKNRCL